ncbi:MAG: OmpH family outer membrane protein, partial [Planctomycetota bacterium]
MKTPPVVLKTLAAALAALVIAPVAHAQQQSPKGVNAKKFKVAVVDIGYIFKNHEGFKAQMESMKGEVSAIEKQLEQKRQKIVAMEETKQKQYTPGSQEYSKMDDDIAKAK